MKIDFSRFYEYVSPHFWKALEDKTRTQIIYGGAGSGKSFTVAMDEVYRQIFEPGSNLLVVRKTGKSNRTSTFALFKLVMSDQHLGCRDLFHIRENDMTIQCKTSGNEIQFFGLDDVEKLKSIVFSGGPLTRIWIEEASEITEADYNQLNLRMRGRARVPFQMRLLFNPISDQHWIKRRFFDTYSERKKTFIHHSTYRDNIFIDEDYRRELEGLKNTDSVFYDIYALGKWGTIGDLVFTNWKEEPCPYSLEDFDEVLHGMDFGFNHPLAIECLGIKDGVLWSFDELYVREKTNLEVINMVKENSFLEKHRKCVADSAEPARIKEWKQNGFRVVPAVKGKDSVHRGIDYLKTKDWRIDPKKCPGLLSELKTYSYKKDRDGNKTDEPINYKDDAIAAVRYAIEEKSRGKSKLFVPSKNY